MYVLKTRGATAEVISLKRLGAAERCQGCSGVSNLLLKAAGKGGQERPSLPARCIVGSALIYAGAAEGAGRSGRRRRSGLARRVGGRGRSGFSELSGPLPPPEAAALPPGPGCRRPRDAAAPTRPQPAPRRPPRTWRRWRRAEPGPARRDASPPAAGEPAPPLGRGRREGSLSPCGAGASAAALAPQGLRGAPAGAARAAAGPGGSGRAPGAAEASGGDRERGRPGPALPVKRRSHISSASIFVCRALPRGSGAARPGQRVPGAPVYFRAFPPRFG